jgi:hypothetical protein
VIDRSKLNLGDPLRDTDLIPVNGLPIRVAAPVAKEKLFHGLGDEPATWAELEFLIIPWFRYLSGAPGLDNPGTRSSGELFLPTTEIRQPLQIFNKACAHLALVARKF